jgi:hypothetical protein
MEDEVEGQAEQCKSPKPHLLVWPSLYNFDQSLNMRCAILNDEAVCGRIGHYLTLLRQERRKDGGEVAGICVIEVYELDHYWISW